MLRVLYVASLLFAVPSDGIEMAVNPQGISTGVVRRMALKSATEGGIATQMDVPPAGVPSSLSAVPSDGFEAAVPPQGTAEGVVRRIGKSTPAAENAATEMPVPLAGVPAGVVRRLTRSGGAVDSTQTSGAQTILPLATPTCDCRATLYQHWVVGYPKDASQTQLPGNEANCNGPLHVNSTSTFCATGDTETFAIATGSSQVFNVVGSNGSNGLGSHVSSVKVQGDQQCEVHAYSASNCVGSYMGTAATPTTQVTNANRWYEPGVVTPGSNLQSKLGWNNDQTKCIQLSCKQLPTIDSETNCATDGSGCARCDRPIGNSASYSYPLGSESCKSTGCCSWWISNNRQDYASACQCQAATPSYKSLGTSGCPGAETKLNVDSEQRETVAECAAYCAATTGCVSFGYRTTKQCHLRAEIYCDTNSAYNYYRLTSQATCPVSATTTDGGSWTGYPTTLAHKRGDNSWIFVTHLGTNVHMVNVDSTGQDLGSRYRQANGIDPNNDAEVIQAWNESSSSSGYFARLTNIQYGSCEATPGWYAGGVDANCNVACEAIGLICTEDGFHDHNSDVDTSDEVLALIRQVGGITSDTNCANTFGSNSDVPQWKSGECLRSSVGRARSSFSCAASPNPAGQSKQRLCYCHQATPGSLAENTLESIHAELESLEHRVDVIENATKA